MNEENSKPTDLAFIEFVIRSIVSEPEKVVIERKIDEMGVLIILKVSKADMGKVIGKNGQTVQAMRILLHIIGSKEQNRVNLKIEEPIE
ncbi:MAG: hypothetical protein UR28_C0042G0005 [Candidatus Peregrinibacteria bacterium GW2011_GWF2_33_10]|nr:MAG: hypothetical protein UR28_C0042G0005 [Candidatus Peregrinibacteria bacterium GW2011_GWF2_33_10]OGJ45258.1 MAG: hypothetical protein A2272_00035 [Candidatus Peregrinibacteria bacterium RIFOXYA12_FULL_33_12]OGJ45693.1 MAG: hypothetical protein A2263_01895 [Candidatus Peregrinibacteria bacterium RIFOXYA2_FULL_33_21]OGJ51269.1 MAG: hypothetical protein A2307_00330 [Candidatus Peregrinibacteria bacterium RIFOXYB2_FULL_33_20]